MAECVRSCCSDCAAWAALQHLLASLNADRGRRSSSATRKVLCMCIGCKPPYPAAAATQLRRPHSGHCRAATSEVNLPAVHHQHQKWRLRLWPRGSCAHWAHCCTTRRVPQAQQHRHARERAASVRERPHCPLCNSCGETAELLRGLSPDCALSAAAGASVASVAAPHLRCAQRAPAPAAAQRRAARGA